MPLRTITLTGADNSTPHTELFDLLDEYPLLEWGILYHGTKEGSGRYPGIGWIHDLLCMAYDRGAIQRLALHLCGESANRAFIKGIGFFSRNLDDLARYFARVQMNINLQKGPFTVADVCVACEGHPQFKVITQHNYANLALCTHPVAPNHQLLFDASGGKGRPPAHWFPVFDHKYCGYAGGLGPHNITDALSDFKRLNPTADYWVDMESLLRNEGGLFDLGNCRQVLNTVTQGAR